METNNQNAVSAVISKAEVLKQTTADFQARTNKELYGILSEIYSLYVNADKDDCLDDSVKQMKEVLVERGVKTQSNTPKMTVFIRYIFNTDRKRSYKYAQTLLAALQAEVKPNALADFISNNNGVEEIKRKRTISDEKQKAIDTLNNAIPSTKAQLKTMDAIQTVKLNQSVTFDDDVEFAFVIARVTANGELELLRAVPKTTVTMEKAAIKQLAEQDIEQAKEEEEKKATESTKDAVKNAAASVRAKDDVKEKELEAA